MADISSFLKKILSAIYGEEVRGSIHDALAAMNTESSSAMEFASTAKDSAQANAAAAKKSAEDADKKATSASESAAAAALSEGSIKTSEKNVNKQAADAKEAAAGQEPQSPFFALCHACSFPFCPAVPAPGNTAVFAIVPQGRKDFHRERTPSGNPLAFFPFSQNFFAFCRQQSVYIP